MATGPIPVTMLSRPDRFVDALKTVDHQAKYRPITL
jgi:hypothetical protein